MKLILYGNEDMELISGDNTARFEGIINFISRHAEDSTAGIQRWAQGFMNKKHVILAQVTDLEKKRYILKLDSYTLDKFPIWI